MGFGGKSDRKLSFNFEQPYPGFFDKHHGNMKVSISSPSEYSFIHAFIGNWEMNYLWRWECTKLFQNVIMYTKKNVGEGSIETNISLYPNV